MDFSAMVLILQLLVVGNHFLPANEHERVGVVSDIQNDAGFYCLALACSSCLL
jgi:hypothetical protein